MAKVIAVFGANSALGAAVAKSLARDSNFMVKAVDPDGSGPYSADIRLVAPKWYSAIWKMWEVYVKCSLDVNVLL